MSKHSRTFKDILCPSSGSMLKTIFFACLVLAYGIVRIQPTLIYSVNHGYSKSVLNIVY